MRGSPAFQATAARTSIVTSAADVNTKGGGGSARSKHRERDQREDHHDDERAPEDEEFKARFLAQEGWLSDPVDVTARALREVVQHLYREDALWQGTLALEGAPVRLQDGRCPVLNLIAKGDGIVPPPASRALAERWGGPVTTREFGGGHVGITVGSRARTGMWSAAAEWLSARDAEETSA